MRPDPAPAHWIRHNAVTRIPRRHVTLDTEARQTPDGAGRVQTFRCAVASFDYQDKAGRPWRPTQWGRFLDPRALWEWIDARTLAGRRTVVVAHNLAYDLRISQAFEHLPALGWELQMIRLDGGSAWCQWRRGERSLVMADTVSWFGAGLEIIGKMVGTEKLALPGWADSDDAWLARCEADVAILRAAWLKVLTWIEREQMGNWKPTGAGQSWAAFRHRFMDTKILHHGVESIAAAERVAAWTGRCEAWKWGRLADGEWSEWDFESAYAHVAEDHELPVRLAGHLGPKGAQRALEPREGRAALIRCRITTDVPMAPARGTHGILWPAGRFESWLWDIEAAAAQRSGAVVECVEGFDYHAAPALRTWAGWVLDRLADPPADLDPVLRLVIKGWSRTLIGRFGSRWSSWFDYGEPIERGVSLGWARDTAEGRDFRLMTVGDKLLAEGECTDAPDGAVHVMSYVMAVCRVRLWAAMAVAGLDHVAYIDTDALLVDREGSDALRAAALPGLRVKGRWSRVEVHGPRQLVLDGKLRAAGVPRRARRVGPLRWEAEVWRSLSKSISQQELDRVVITDRTYNLRGVDHRRRHLADGLTAPFAVTLD